MNVVTVVLDGIELIKMRELAFIEYENRMKLGINMKQIEVEAKDAGFLTETDDPADITPEFYPVISEDSKGTSAEAAKEKLQAKTEPEKPANKEGDLL